jgi:hypothetical protein
MAQNPIVGVWQLVSCEAIRTNGTRVPIYGRHPVGLLLYDEAGNMSVNIMRSGRPRARADTKFGASDAEMKVAYEGYEAYFSRYTVHAERGIIEHKVVGSLFPNWTGSIQERYFAFDGADRVTLSTAPLGSPPGDKTIVELVWQRCGAPPRSQPCA